MFEEQVLIFKAFGRVVKVEGLRDWRHYLIQCNFSWGIYLSIIIYFIYHFSLTKCLLQCILFLLCTPRLPIYCLPFYSATRPHHHLYPLSSCPQLSDLPFLASHISFCSSYMLSSLLNCIHCCSSLNCIGFLSYFPISHLFL